MMITPLPAAGERAGLSFGRVMGWLTVLFMLSWPRLCLLGFWIFGDLVGKAIHSSAVCVLGFLLLPTTTFAYAVMWGASSDKVSRRRVDRRRHRLPARRRHLVRPLPPDPSADR